MTPIIEIIHIGNSLWINALYMVFKRRGEHIPLSWEKFSILTSQVPRTDAGTARRLIL